MIIIISLCCRKRFNQILWLILNQVDATVSAKGKKTSFADSGNKSSTGNGKSNIFLLIFASLLVIVLGYWHVLQGLSNQAKSLGSSRFQLEDLVLERIFN